MAKALRPQPVGYYTGANLLAAVTFLNEVAAVPFSGLARHNY